MNNNRFRLVITGGGTGGHIFPGLAIIEALKELCILDVMWIGSGRKIEHEILSKKELKYKVLPVKPIKGRDLAQLFISLAYLPISIAKSVKMLRDFNPSLVVGVGGYVSGPVLFAAKMVGIKTAIHEQNSIPGLANRIASKFVDKIYTSFPDSAGYFNGKDVECLGNPIREDILKVQNIDTEGQTSEGPLKILIIGGSQGASGLNRLVSSALKILKQSGRSFQAIHQTGPADKKRLEHLYSAFNMDVKIKEFIDEMGIAYSWADLIICRAGASTLSEITALGKPSICIPYPYAADGHQEMNAKSLKEAGACLCFNERDLGAVTLASQIEELMLDRQKLMQMAKKAKSLGKPNAAKDIANSILSLCKMEESIKRTKKEGTNNNV